MAESFPENLLVMKNYYAIWPKFDFIMFYRRCFGAACHHQRIMKWSLNKNYQCKSENIADSFQLWLLCIKTLCLPPKNVINIWLKTYKIVLVCRVSFKCAWRNTRTCIMILHVLLKLLIIWLLDRKKINDLQVLNFDPLAILT